MALSPFSPSNFASSSSCSLHFSPSFHYLLQPQNRFLYISRAVRFRISCSNHTVEFDTQQPRRIKVAFEVTKKKRKPRPSFLEQIQEKWSTKTTSTREKFPWQEEQPSEQQEQKEKRDEGHQSSGVLVNEANVDVNPSASDSVSIASPYRSISAPWAHGSLATKHQVDSRPEFSRETGVKREEFDSFIRNSPNVIANAVENGRGIDNAADSDSKWKREAGQNFDAMSKGTVLEDKGKIKSTGVQGVYIKEKPLMVPETFNNFARSDNDSMGSRLPWKRDNRMDSDEEDKKRRRSNTELSETMLPEHELRRLRNIALRMLERTKVGVAGITQELVDSIHEKWKTDEVVKLKFEGPLTLNMKKTHEILESKTGGLVIWRSGSSVVLYRGMTYNLPCVQSYTKLSQTNVNVSDKPKESISDAVNDIGMKGSLETTNSVLPGDSKYLKYLSKRELMEMSDLNKILDELGPRFKDWSGREPLPVDADLLPAVVPGFKPPFRVLPYKVRHCLKNKETTTFRRLARIMPPHFALGRNRELQGLAKAIVKLWERCAIAKIAIKRGVENTCNERMAEELKRLTGGILLSRNKEFIVFYRGNDFLPPRVTEILKERRKETDLRQDEEEQARNAASASIEPNSKSSKGSLVAGTLAETMAATSRWGSQPTSEDVENMKRDSALAKQASLLRSLEKRLALAKGKVKKTEKALAKLHANLEPSDLPTDLETIADEERFLLRRVGLSMKPYLLLGRRGVYDGTIENMHLHWKFRELVKVIVKGKSFPLVKHIAISLEAESGGVLVSVDKTNKGYEIIIYRGKNYSRPDALKPKNLLTKRQALARSVELQRREALKHHIVDLEENIESVKSELEDMKNGKIIDGRTTFNLTLDDLHLSDDNMEEEGEEHEAYKSSDEEVGNW